MVVEMTMGWGGVVGDWILGYAVRDGFYAKGIKRYECDGEPWLEAYVYFRIKFTWNLLQEGTWEDTEFS